MIAIMAARSSRRDFLQPSLMLLLHAAPDTGFPFEITSLHSGRFWPVICAFSVLHASIISELIVTCSC